MKKILLLCVILVSAPQLFPGNRDLALKSALVPGMGQISAGVGDVKSFNTMKGLGIMAGFTFCLHGMISSISERESYAEQTQYYADQIRISKDYNKYLKLDSAHNNAYDNYKTANTWTFVYLGLTAVVYGYGIVDALLYTREETKKEAAIEQQKQGKVNFAIANIGQGTGLKVNYHF